MSRERERARQIREPFVGMDINDANRECSANVKPGTLGREREQTKFTSCPACQSRVGLHCFTCKIQVTGCLCSEYKRYGQDVAWQRAVARWGEAAARQRAEMAGLWVPPSR
jgi:hypothetical protein